MKWMLGGVAVSALAVTVCAAETSRLTVRVGNARAGDGRVIVALYDSPAGFPGGDRAVRTAAAPIEGGRAAVDFADLAPGTYAVAVIHDENGNGKLDTGLLGIPSEGIGASNGAQGRFGPARFEKAKFAVAGDMAIDVALVYVGF